MGAGKAWRFRMYPQPPLWWPPLSTTAVLSSLLCAHFCFHRGSMQDSGDRRPGPQEPHVAALREAPLSTSLHILLPQGHRLHTCNTVFRAQRTCTSFVFSPGALIKAGILAPAGRDQGRSFFQAPGKGTRATELGHSGQLQSGPVWHLLASDPKLSLS